ncbi:hypothetical protein KIN20_025371 [Parelaphostrongylus tenuis]|uniref:Uncharacterized protein n=1 Tax=Parelaphostrongylus tenuis TaxID=148309 RepID=A0AAD5NDC1_PARTN|nr:hypothetical protein KIN20_025371 [Parelaphostrongylus tenuis]
MSLPIDGWRETRSKNCPICRGRTKATQIIHHLYFSNWDELDAAQLEFSNEAQYPVSAVQDDEREYNQRTANR